MKAIFVKELRDVIRLAPVGFIFTTAFVFMSLPDSSYAASMVDSQLVAPVALVGGLFAIALGLYQSLPDSRADARGYLLHRTATPSEIYWGKVGAGFVAYLIATVIPLLMLGVRLAWIGIEVMPVSALQVLPALLVSVLMYLMHPTMIWIVYRDARWLGTRLLPAVFVSTVFGFVVGSLIQWIHGTELFTITLLLAAVLMVALIVLTSGRHAFTALSFLPPPSSPKRRHLPSALGLLLGAVMGYGVVVVFVLLSLPGEKRDRKIYQVVLDRDGQWWEVEQKYSAKNWNQQAIAKRPINSDEAFQEVSDTSPWVDATPLSMQTWAHDHYSLAQFEFLGQFGTRTRRGAITTLIQSGGKLLAYGASDQLLGIVTPEGTFHHPNEVTGGFQNPSLGFYMGGDWKNGYSNEANPVIFHDRGVYQIDLENVVARELVDHPVEGLGMIFENDQHPASFWTINQGSLIRYDVKPLNPDDSMPRNDDQVIRDTSIVSIPQIVISEAERFTVEPIGKHETLRVVRSTEGDHYLLRNDLLNNIQIVPLADTEEIISVQTEQNDNGNESEFAVAAWGFPPIISAGVYALVVLFTSEVGRLPIPASLWIMVSLHVALSIGVMIWLTRGRGLSTRARTMWVVIAGLFGMGTSLAVVAIVPKPIMVPCPRCEKLRCVDQERCELCDQLFDPPPAEGIEILESESPRRLSYT
ncbi:hypothetical protein [Stieleria varia]|uniref:Uncharacterized protein n=1 Tax=Stieleria varia TaxID=2528005 RepID=A0A5C6A1Y0_9BACT|nr:hypothetical protein [Stieleria varia]TWT93862.1 hypothetical protein Pla52n_56900 [Stieleria varia]